MRAFSGGLFVSIAVFTYAFAACSISTSWDDLPIDVAPNADGGVAEASAPACEAGRYYCGGNGVVGYPETLYLCLADGGTSPALPCNHGCARRPGRSDACICVVGSPYCGNDQIVGDEDSLYLCERDYSGTLVKKCDAGCIVNANANDACR